MRTYATKILSTLTLAGALLGIGCTMPPSGGLGGGDGGAGLSADGGMMKGLLPGLMSGSDGGMIKGGGLGALNPGPGPQPNPDPSPNPGPGPTTGAATCGQIIQCLNTCNDGDTACFNNCRAKGSPAAQSAFNALLSCAQQCQDDACLETRCGAQLQACLNPSGPAPNPDPNPNPPTGGSTCGQIIQCLNACNDGDTACANNCRAKGSPAAQSAFNALLSCAQQCQDDACLETRCGAQLQACLGSAPPPGGGGG
jgi:hypothetical protein